MGQSLKQKAISGVTWSLTERFGVQGMRFVLGIILARMLMPEHYGLIGMITVFIVVAEVFVSGGFGQAYIQKKEVTDLDANTVFYINLVISVTIYGFLWLGALIMLGRWNELDLHGAFSLIIVFCCRPVKESPEHVARGLRI